MKDHTVEKIVKQQYKNSDHLSTRISIHDKYSVNKQGFGNWINTQYDLKPDYKILELGCGTGSMWCNQLDLLKENAHLILTDFSEGMLQSAKNNLGIRNNIEYKVVDIQNIPYEDHSFDVVIANMMLYHVPNLKRGLLEVTRVLKKGGTFYAATYGEHGILEYITSLFSDYNIINNTNTTFTLQNGNSILSKYFSSVEKKEYEDALAVTNIEDMIDYLDSYSSMSNLSELNHQTISRVLTDNMINGILRVPKEYGMFICKN